jgi:hypothetical protein
MMSVMKRMKTILVVAVEVLVVSGHTPKNELTFLSFVKQVKITVVSLTYSHQK